MNDGTKSTDIDTYPHQNADYGRPSQRATLRFVEDRWPHLADPQSRLNKLGEEYGEVVGAFVKMHDGTGRKTLDDLAQETAQMVICAMALAEALGFDLDREVAAEWVRACKRTWPKAAHIDRSGSGPNDR